MGDRIKALDIWYQMPPGSFIWKYEQKLLQEAVAACCGEVLLQVGGKSGFGWLGSDCFKHRVQFVTTANANDGSQVEIALDAWPVLPSSVDVLLLPHVLETVENPENILSEAYEALPLGGKLIVLSFNRVSLWGLKKLLRNNHGFPWELNFFTPWRIHRLLTDAGFEVKNRSSYYFRPAFSHASLVNSFAILETLGSILYPLCGASMIIIAEKTACIPTLRNKKNKSWIKAKAPVV
jgi:hypothetical protein